VAVGDTRGSDTTARRLVYLRQTKKDAKRLAVYSLFILLLGAAAAGTRMPKLLIYALLGLGGYFAILAVINLLASMKHAKALQVNQQGASGSSRSAIESEEDVTLAGDIVRLLDFNALHPPIRFVHLRDQGQAYDSCVDRIYGSIDRDRPRFVQTFIEFKALNCARYPDHSDLIGSLQMEHLIVYRTRGERTCLARVHFVGDLGDVWYAEYDGEGFSDLIWV
jgi:hypothetical protein